MLADPWQQFADDSSSGESGRAVLQLAQQVQGSGKEEEGQGSVPELLGESSNALDKRTAQQLQQALQVSSSADST